MNAGSRRIVVTTVAVLVAVAVAFAVVALMRPADAGTGATPSPSPSLSASASTEATGTPSSPPAPSPSAPAASEEPSAPPAPEPGTTDAPLAPATVTVTFSGWDAAAGAAVVGGYVDTLEGSGTCTITMTLGDKVVTRAATATPDATTMSCGELSVPRTALSAGTWQTVLSYSSTTRAGSAPAVTIEVP